MERVSKYIWGYALCLIVVSMPLSACKRGFYRDARDPVPELQSYIGMKAIPITAADSQDDEYRYVDRNHRAPLSTPAVGHAPQHIALLLPLHGPLGASGRAVRNGFLAAYYRAKAQQGSAPKLTILDTSEASAAVLYQRALYQGADFIVGPLSRRSLMALVGGHELTVPTLALNTLNNNALKQAQLFQFALTPSDEAYQATEKAWQDNHKRAAIITPNNAWGRGIARTFIRHWQARGGRVLAKVSYSNEQSLNADIKALLNVDRSEERAQGVEEALREGLRFKARRRRDIDVIFLAALPKQARQIRPLIKFYYGGKIAIYATSAVYSGMPSPREDQDLNGIRFCDAPWILTTPDALSDEFRDIHQRILSTWPTEYRRHPKLYAFGIDAYRLIYALDAMRNNANVALHGATGTLYLTPHGRIYRQLAWALFRQGQATLIH